MKKIIISVIVILILAVAGGVYYVLTNLDALVKAAIETHGSQATKTAVRLGKVHIELKDGAATFNNLTVANPQGYGDPHVFSLGVIRGKINLKSLQKEPYIIDEIVIRKPLVFMEMNKDNKTNLIELQKNLGAGKPAKKTKPAAPAKAGDAGPRLILRRVVFADGEINARVVPLENKEYKLKLPNINMTNLGGKNGATGSELAREILTRLTDQAIETIKKRGIDAEVDKLKAKANEAIEKEKAKLKEKSDAALEKEKKKAADKLKGLLKR